MAAKKKEQGVKRLSLRGPQFKYLEQDGAASREPAKPREAPNEPTPVDIRRMLIRAVKGVK